MRAEDLVHLKTNLTFSLLAIKLMKLLMRVKEKEKRLEAVTSLSRKGKVKNLVGVNLLGKERGPEGTDT